VRTMTTFQFAMVALLTASIAVGILGATVMPHSLFLGSALATQDRISFRAPQDAETLNTVSKKDTDDSLQNQPSGKVPYLRRLYQKIPKFILDAFVKPPANLYYYGERENNSFEFVRAHIYYGMFDIIGSLFGFAVMINSL
jgi:metal iron transporter